jgi:mannosyltransferase OCH1-like enzyme
MSGIPQILHLTCKEKPIPERYQFFLQRMIDFHPGWKCILYDDQEAEIIISQHFPKILDIYRSYPYGIQRSDIFRIIAVYLYGGFYLDLDIYCLEKLDELCSHTIVLGEEKTLTEEQNKVLRHKYPLRIANYMFGSVPGHKFWLEFLNEAMRLSPMRIETEDDILNSTGPGLLTDVYHEKRSGYPDIVLLPRPGYKCMNKWCQQDSCHFGHFAAHFHLGSWRWNNKR